jgi:hypothetical protein
LESRDCALAEATAVLYLLLSRFFLLALLACDWASDPYFGRSPLSRPLHSQVAYCHSTLYHAQLIQSITSRDLNFLCLPTTIAFSPSIHAPVARCGEDQAWFLPPGRSLYTFMSLQC